MNLPHHAPPIRGFLLRVLARLSAVGALRRVLLRKLLKDTRIRELPTQW